MAQFMIPVVISLVIFLSNLSVLHYFAKSACILCSRFGRFLVPFGMGFSVVLLLFRLLPSTFRENLSGSFMFLAAPTISFLVFFLLDHLIFRRVVKQKLTYDLKAVHGTILFFMNVLAGILLYNIFNTDKVLAYIFAIPLLFLTMTENSSFHLVNEREYEFVYVLGSLAVSIGVIVAIILPVAELFQQVIFSFLMGWFLFAFLQELLQKKERNYWFLIQGFIFAFIGLYLLHMLGL